MVLRMLWTVVDRLHLEFSFIVSLSVLISVFPGMLRTHISSAAPRLLPPAVGFFWVLAGWGFSAGCRGLRGRLSAPKPIVDLATVNFKVLYVSPYDDGGN